MKFIFSLTIFILPFTSFAQQKPKIVVGIVVDQMRYDYLTRFYNRFSDNGFKKLINNGYNCKNTHYNYMPTFTAPGHASIFAGTTPENHGIIANNWFNKASGKYIYCTEDHTVNTIGSNSKSGKMSPTHLISTTITDELRLASNYKSKTFGISIKDRGAILPAGHNTNGAFWFDGNDEGVWISSTFYFDELPKWLVQFNKKKPAEKYLNKKWKTLYPLSTYTASIADDNPYEVTFKTEKNPIFPHNLPALRDSNDNFSLIKSTPFGNTILKDLALELIKKEELGKDNYTDFLSISFSSPDYIGHRYGPMSVEIEDTYLRLDKDIAEIINYLETHIGKDNFILFLTADHGAVNVPQYLIDNKIPAGYFDEKELEKNLNVFLSKRLKTDSSIVKSISNQQVYLGKKIRPAKKPIIENLIAEFLVKQEGIAKVITATALKNTEFTERLLANVQRGYNQSRSGDVLFILEPGWIPLYTSKKGTTHGSPYHYDTHVPLIWYGNGIKSGATHREIIISDIAATIAQLLDIQAPNACTGKPILEITTP